MSASLEGNVGSREFVAYPARVANVEKRRRRSVRDCGMKLTMDGKLSRKEVRKREKRGRKGEKSCQKGNEKRSELERVQCKWRTERERERRQLLIESEFEETQKKGEKKREKSAKIGPQIEGGALPTQLNGTKGR